MLNTKNKTSKSKADESLLHEGRYVPVSIVHDQVAMGILHGIRKQGRKRDLGPGVPGEWSEFRDLVYASGITFDPREEPIAETWDDFRNQLLEEAGHGKRALEDNDEDGPGITFHDATTTSLDATLAETWEEYRDYLQRLYIYGDFVAVQIDAKWMRKFERALEGGTRGFIEGFGLNGGILGGVVRISRD